MNRNPSLDVLRGLLLVLMTMTHLPTVWSGNLWQPLGFVSAAEGFVFLSAFLAGSIYTRQSHQTGQGSADAWMLRRAAQLYLLHLALLILAFTLVAWIAQTYERPAAKNLLDFYLQSPTRAIIGSAVLVYQPPLLDILPMYVIFMLATPLVMRAASCQGWRGPLCLSMAIWIAAQFGLRGTVYAALNTHLNLDLPMSATGAFDLFAWQFLWVLGLWVGALGLDQRWREHLPGTALLNTALAVSFALFIWRHYSGPLGVEDAARHFFWIDKWSLSPVRVINLAALTALLLAIGPYLGQRIRIAPLEALGRSSQWVFMAHIGSVLLAICLIGQDDQPLAGSLGLASIVLGYAVLFGAAALHRHLRSRAP
ncbi:MAG: OpgC domain-containing protein [Panacagrimonas sp.]